MTGIIPALRRSSQLISVESDRHSTVKELKMRYIVRVSSFVVIVLLVLSTAGIAKARSTINVSNYPNVNVSHRLGNESEEAIAVNPTNPNNIVIFTNIAEGEAGMFLAVTFDGGLTWTTDIVGERDDVFGDTCCDPSAAFDEYGNLFLSYLYNVENTVPILLSTDGGITFELIAKIAKPVDSLISPSGAERHGLFRYVDQETVTAGNGQVWVVFNAGGPMVAAGAPVTGLGQVGAFSGAQLAPGTNNCTYGDIAIGPEGQVMQVCNHNSTGQGGGKVFVNLDPDGVGPAGFGNSIFVTATHVGGFDFIPPQPDRSVDAESGLAWDRTGSHPGRVYLVYTKEEQNESDDMNIYVRYSDDDGATWSAAVRVNDDHTVNSQFNPKISLDQTTGNIAVVWYDSRMDIGAGGPGDTDGVPNTDAQFWGAFSSDGVNFTPNFQISAGTSNSHVSGNRIDYGDYSGLSFFGGIAHPAWSDNSNSTGDNPDGTLSKLDIYTAGVPYIP